MSCLRRDQLSFAFWFGDRVYLRIREERVVGLVTGMQIRPNGVLYQVTWPNAGDTHHYDFELTTEFEPNYEVG